MTCPYRKKSGGSLTRPYREKSGGSFDPPVFCLGKSDSDIHVMDYKKDKNSFYLTYENYECIIKAYHYLRRHLYENNENY